MSPAELEQAYELLAQALDRVPEDKERLFLSKLALVLADACGDLEALRRAIDTAAGNLD